MTSTVVSLRVPSRPAAGGAVPRPATTTPRSTFLSAVDRIGQFDTTTEELSATSTSSASAAATAAGRYGLRPAEEDDTLLRRPSTVVPRCPAPSRPTTAERTFRTAMDRTWTESWETKVVGDKAAGPDRSPSSSSPAKTTSRVAERPPGPVARQTQAEIRELLASRIREAKRTKRLLRDHPNLLRPSTTKRNAVTSDSGRTIDERHSHATDDENEESGGDEGKRPPRPAPRVVSAFATIATSRASISAALDRDEELNTFCDVVGQLDLLTRNGAVTRLGLLRKFGDVVRQHATDAMRTVAPLSHSGTTSVVVEEAENEDAQGEVDEEEAGDGRSRSLFLADHSVNGLRLADTVRRERAAEQRRRDAVSLWRAKATAQQRDLEAAQHALAARTDEVETLRTAVRDVEQAHATALAAAHRAHREALRGAVRRAVEETRVQHGQAAESAAGAEMRRLRHCVNELQREGHEIKEKLRASDAAATALKQTLVAKEQEVERLELVLALRETERTAKREDGLRRTVEESVLQSATVERLAAKVSDLTEQVAKGAADRAAQEERLLGMLRTQATAHARQLETLQRHVATQHSALQDRDAELAVAKRELAKIADEWGSSALAAAKTASFRRNERS